MMTNQPAFGRVVPGSAIRTTDGVSFHARIDAGEAAGRTILLEKARRFGQRHYSADGGETWHRSVRDAVHVSATAGMLLYADIKEAR